MELWSLFLVACMPIMQVLFVGLLGALLATDYINLLPSEARSYINKVKCSSLKIKFPKAFCSVVLHPPSSRAQIVFVVFAPALVFASLAKSVTLQDIISW